MLPDGKVGPALHVFRNCIHAVDKVVANAYNDTTVLRGMTIFENICT